MAETGPISSKTKMGVAVAVVAVAMWGLVKPMGGYFSSAGGAAHLVEPATGIGFGEKVDGLELLGAGVRVKKIGPIKVNVYAVGAYGKSLDRGRRVLRLVFARNVAGPTIVEALASVKGPSDDVLAKFKAHMLDAIGGSIKKTETIDLGCAPHAGSLAVAVRGAKSTNVKGHKLCDAVFDLFLDPAKTVSPALLKSVAARS